MTFMSEDVRPFIKDKVMIFVDTSTLMQPKGIMKLVKDNERLIYREKFKFVVIKSVWLELTRLFNSADKSTSEKAGKAISYISSNRDFFYIEDDIEGLKDLDDAFADKDLLARILDAKCKQNVMLLTYDKALARDASYLNSLHSIKGFRVTTYFVANNGMLITTKNLGNNGYKYQSFKAKNANQAAKGKRSKLTKKQKAKLRKAAIIVLPIITLIAGLSLGLGIGSLDLL